MFLSLAQCLSCVPFCGEAIEAAVEPVLAGVTFFVAVCVTLVFAAIAIMVLNPVKGIALLVSRPQ
jgi:hypothetical protein